MPFTVPGNPGYLPIPTERYEHINYDYADGFDWTPGSDHHQKIVSLILTRAHDAHAAISTRFDSWREMDNKLKVYVSPETLDRMEQARSHEHEEDKLCLMQEERIVFPYTYSILEGLLTYLTAAFIQDPIFQYSPVEADDVIAAALMELVVQVHCVKSKVPLAIHTVLRDSLAYGYGIAIPGWRRQIGKRVVRTQDPSNDKLFIPDLLFEGNTLDPVSPYMVLADPNVSSVGLQDGEFFGWVERTNYMRLAEAENEIDSEYFNVRYLRQRQQARSVFATDHSVDGAPGEHSSKALASTSPVDLIKMYITLIPSEWELGDSDVPEKWYFELASDSIIIRANPADHAHGMYPVAVATPEFDGYDAFPIGRLEILDGLQKTLDFLFYSHITNVRKGVNNMWLVDPHRVNMPDLLNPRPGKLIRLRRDVWGTGVNDAIQQLQVNDVTRGNISDAQYITQWADRISGADAAMSGFLRQTGPERLTAKEFLGTQQNAMGRLQRLAQSISMQFMNDVATMFAIHTKQYMQESSYIQLTGRHAERLKMEFGVNAIEVTPFDISAEYDIIPRDGSLPGGQGAQVMMQMFELIAGSPELAMTFDVNRIFSYIAAQFGVKNVDDFRRINTQVMPDQQVEQQVQAGNLVPMGGM